MNASLLIANVMHARQRPKRHRFTYRVFYLCFSLPKMADLATKVLSLERWNLFSFFTVDHGSRDGKPLEAWIRNILNTHRLVDANGDIVLLTLPRILGYVFNPVSFWFCFDKAKNLRAVLSEVCNTFGERHCYLSYHDDHRVISAHDWLRAEKLFHVSPFLPLTGHYMFRFACDESAVSVNINYFDAEGLMLATSVSGTRGPLTTIKLLHCFVRYPLVTLKIIALIHAEALRLLMKGVRYYPKPPSPTIEVSR